MANNKGLMTDEIFRQLIKEDKWIREIAHAVEGVRYNGNVKEHLYWRTVSYPDEYYVTEAQISEAKKHYQRRHDEEMANLKKGELAFVCMGSMYSPKKENGVGCYRIRCEFKNINGNHYFIEFSLSGRGDEMYYIDFSIDRDRQAEYEKAHLQWWQKNKDLPLRKRENFNFNEGCHCACGVGRNMEVSATFPDILDFVNRHYKCNYKSVKLFEYFISPDEYINEC